MNKRQAKKQRRLEAVRLLEEMNQHECAVLFRDRNSGGNIMMVINGAEITLECFRPSPYGVEYRDVRIDEHMTSMKKVGIKDGCC